MGESESEDGGPKERENRMGSASRLRNSADAALCHRTPLRNCFGTCRVLVLDVVPTRDKDSVAIDKREKTKAIEFLWSLRPLERVDARDSRTSETCWTLHSKALVPSTRPSAIS